MQANEEEEAGDFIHRQGPAYLAHLLRRLSDELVRGAEAWYPEVSVTVSPRTTSTLLALDEHGPLGITEISSLLRQSHPLVINWIKELRAQGLVRTGIDKQDRRRTVVALTTKGVGEIRHLRKALVRMGETSQALMDEAAPGLFQALWRMEQACRRKSFDERLRNSCRAPMRIDRLEHVQMAMPVGGEVLARGFYRDVLGIPEIPKPASLAKRGGCWFERGELKIHLGVEADFRPARKAHAALLVVDLEALIGNLKVAGYTVRDDESLAGYHRVYVDDPFGNRIELMEPAAA
jgi:MarR family transcriptional regulator, organic hydroperoxide resistance regulator